MGEGGQNMNLWQTTALYLNNPTLGWVAALAYIFQTEREALNEALEEQTEDELSWWDDSDETDVFEESLDTGQVIDRIFDPDYRHN